MNKTAPTAVWVTVSDAQGRRHLEMRWVSPEPAALPLAHAA